MGCREKSAGVVEDRESGVTAIPDGVDPSVPSPARMYDYYLGGSQNYPADRRAAEVALSVVPTGRSIARANRYFLMRSVILLADKGIRQFIDLGTGIATSPSVHELAQAIIPDARVLYVDSDPVVISHNKALLDGTAGVGMIHADIRDTASILGSPVFGELIDLSQPVGLLCVAVLHFVPEDPRRIVRAFADRMAPGSHLVLSHVTSTGMHPSVVKMIEDAYADATAPAVFRGLGEIREMFTGFGMVGPGLQDVTCWLPYGRAASHTQTEAGVLAGLGCKW